MTAVAAIAAVFALAGAGLACIPGLHVYNVIGALLLLSTAPPLAEVVAPEWIAVAVLSMLVAFSLVNSIPAVFFSAPDESVAFVVLPAQKLYRTGRGLEAAYLTLLGGVAGLAAVVVVFALVGPRLLPAARALCQPHLHWFVWCVIAFMLMAEWPKGDNRGFHRGHRLARAWAGLAAGLATFALSGLLGMILFHRSPMPPGSSFQGLMPAFVGLFAIPGLLLNLVSRARIAPQSARIDPIRPDELLHGVTAGVLGGAFAAFVPAVTGGVGGMLAGHATAMRGDRAFLISQGASRTVYYTGALLLFFVPGLTMQRGGGAALIAGHYLPSGFPSFYAALGVTCVAAAVSLAVFLPLCRIAGAIPQRWGLFRTSLLAMGLAAGLVMTLCGPWGLATTAVATGIGLLPVLFGSRRMNCLGIILLPVALNLSGVGDRVACWLGLIQP